MHLVAGAGIAGGWLTRDWASLSACSFRVSQCGLVWASSEHGSFRVVELLMWWLKDYQLGCSNRPAVSSIAFYDLALEVT